MQRPPLYSRLAISAILILQLIPLLLFPPDVYASGSQQWWLPGILSAMAVIAVVNLFLRGGMNLWPWLLISFVQGFNIISRLMLIWPQGSSRAGGTTAPDVTYVSATALAIALSIFLLWYTEKPAVRQGLLRG